LVFKLFSTLISPTGTFAQFHSKPGDSQQIGAGRPAAIKKWAIKHVIKQFPLKPVNIGFKKSRILQQQKILELIRR
jgi:hypothetical protein